MDISIDSLHLDLRGVPRHVAEAVPALLGPALQEAAVREAAHREAVDQPASADRLPEVHLTLGRADTAPALARQIATALVRCFKTPAAEPPTPTV